MVVALSGQGQPHRRAGTPAAPYLRVCFGAGSSGQEPSRGLGPHLVYTGGLGGCMGRGKSELDLNLRGGSFDVTEVGRELDALRPAERVAAIHSLSPRAQAHLYEAAKGVRK